MNIKAIARSKGWTANKKTLSGPGRIDGSDLAAAQQMHAQGHYETAIEYLNSFDDANTDPAALRVRALCELGLGQIEDSQKTLEFARELDLHSLARDEVNLSIVFITSKRYDDAHQAALRARSFDPLWPGAHINLLAIANRRNDEEMVKTILKEAMANWPSVLEHPDFIDRLKNDVDLTGIRNRHPYLLQTKH